MSLRNKALASKAPLLKNFKKKGALSQRAVKFCGIIKPREAARRKAACGKAQRGKGGAGVRALFPGKLRDALRDALERQAKGKPGKFPARIGALGEAARGEAGTGKFVGLYGARRAIRFPGAGVLAGLPPGDLGDLTLMAEAGSAAGAAHPGEKKESNVVMVNFMRKYLGRRNCGAFNVTLRRATRSGGRRAARFLRLILQVSRLPGSPSEAFLAPDYSGLDQLVTASGRA